MLTLLYVFFLKNGPDAIERTRKDQPSAYLSAVECRSCLRFYFFAEALWPLSNQCTRQLVSQKLC